MKILLTGGNGFLARSLLPRLQTCYDVTSVGRKELDLTKSETVKGFFKNKEFDVVIHTAIEGGNRIEDDTSDNFYNNLLMFENLMMYKDKFKLIINFGSGAEFDRSRNLHNLWETNLGESIPRDYYGLSKYIICNRLKSIPNAITLRLFNVFSEFEEDSRMVKSNIIRYINHEPIILHKFRWMDFIGIDDLYKVVDYIIKNHKTLEYRDYNVCYNRIVNTYWIAEMINNLDDYKVEIIVLNDEGDSKSYTGHDHRLGKIKHEIGLDGLEKSIKKLYKYLKSEIEEK